MKKPGPGPRFVIAAMPERDQPRSARAARRCVRVAPVLLSVVVVVVVLVVVSVLVVPVPMVELELDGVVAVLGIVLPVPALLVPALLVPEVLVLVSAGIVDEVVPVLELGIVLVLLDELGVVVLVPVADEVPALLVLVVPEVFESGWPVAVPVVPAPAPVLEVPVPCWAWARPASEMTAAATASCLKNDMWTPACKMVEGARRGTPPQSRQEQVARRVPPA